MVEASEHLATPHERLERQGFGLLEPPLRVVQGAQVVEGREGLGVLVTKLDAAPCDASYEPKDTGANTHAPSGGGRQ